MHLSTDREDVLPSTPISFLWLELTNRCNLKCSHCYANSSPQSGSEDSLHRSDYEQIIAEGATLGCRQIQFIGGEPTLHRDLPHFIETAQQNGYEFIEVFTNLTRLNEDLLECFNKYGVHVATSVYAASDEIHDAVTGMQGSFQKTIKNIRKLVEVGVPVRAGIVTMKQNADQAEITVEFLKGIGVQNVGTDRLRHFGRGVEMHGQEQMSELCGSCAGRTLCVAPNGDVSPCIMSKKWSVGSLRDLSLKELANSRELEEVRKQIYSAVEVAHIDRNQIQAQCDPSKPCFPCGPDAQCSPCRPNTNCPPNHCRPYCMPNPG